MTGQKLRGFVGQGMNGRRPKPRLTIVDLIDTAVSGSCVIPTGGVAFIGLYGAGQSGVSISQGGFGGDAVFSLIQLQQGWTLTWTPGVGGSPGGDTTLSWPAGSMLARGGASTSVNIGQYASAGGPGGTAGNGGAGSDGGGAGGIGGGNGGGGGGAGLASKFPGFSQGGQGGTASSGNENGHFPGGGGAGDSTPGPGAGGRILILIMQQIGT